MIGAGRFPDARGHQSRSAIRTDIPFRLDRLPWLPLANDYVRENMANLSADTRSVLNLYRALIELRKATPVACGRQLRARCCDRRLVGLQA